MTVCNAAGLYSLIETLDAIGCVYTNLLMQETVTTRKQTKEALHLSFKVGN